MLNSRERAGVLFHDPHEGDATSVEWTGCFLADVLFALRSHDPGRGRRGTFGRATVAAHGGPEPAASRKRSSWLLGTPRRSGPQAFPQVCAKWVPSRAAGCWPMAAPASAGRSHRIQEKDGRAAPVGRNCNENPSKARNEHAILFDVCGVRNVGQRHVWPARPRGRKIRIIGKVHCAGRSRVKIPCRSTIRSLTISGTGCLPRSTFGRARFPRGPNTRTIRPNWTNGTASYGAGSWCQAPWSNASGGDVLAFLAWQKTRHYSEPATFQRANKLLDEFIEGRGERLIDDPLKRAFFQRDLWAVFDHLVGQKIARFWRCRPGETAGRGAGLQD